LEARRYSITGSKPIGVGARELHRLRDVFCSGVFRLAFWPGIRAMEAESPLAEHMPKEFAHRILHARLVLPGGGTLFAGDAPANLPYAGIKRVSIAVDYATTTQAEQVFNALAEGGQVTMPVQAAFWAKSWGMLFDKFGSSWIVNGEPTAF